MISPETASLIWNCHREISVAMKLEEEITTALREGKDPTPLDSWGDRRDFQLGVPSGESSHKLYKVAPRLALSIIRAHIAEKKSELVSANEQARIELEDPTVNAGDHRPFTIIVNGYKETWDQREDRAITYTQLLALAKFHPEAKVSITYHTNDRQGTLGPDQTVIVEDGMIFTVKPKQ